MSVSSSQSIADPAAEAAQLLSRIGMALIAIAAPCAAMGARRAIFILMPVGAALILIAALLGGRRDSLRPLAAWLGSPIGLAALLFAFWSGLSLAWTPFPAEAAARLGKAAGTVALAMLAAAFLPQRTRASNLYLLPIGAGLASLAAVFVLYEGPALLATIVDGDDSTLERGMDGLAVLLWPALAAVAERGRWTLASLVAILAISAAVLVPAPLAQLGLLAGAVVFALAVSAPVFAGRLLAVVAALALLAAPALPLALALLPRDGLLRPDGALAETMASIDVWRGIVVNDGWRLLTGHGIDTATRGVARGLLKPDLPGGILFEVWYELGAVGAASLATLSALGFLAAGRLGRTAAPFVLAGLAVPLAMAMLSLSTAQLWWVNALGLCAICFTHVARAEQRAGRPSVRRVNGRVALPA